MKWSEDDLIAAKLIFIQRFCQLKAHRYLSSKGPDDWRISRAPNEGPCPQAIFHPRSVFFPKNTWKTTVKSYPTPPWWNVTTYDSLMTPSFPLNYERLTLRFPMPASHVITFDRILHLYHSGETMLVVICWGPAGIRHVCWVEGKWVFDHTHICVCVYVNKWMNILFTMYLFDCLYIFRVRSHVLCLYRYDWWFLATVTIVIL